MPEPTGSTSVVTVRMFLGRSRSCFAPARDDEIDRVMGLEIGGDDYVIKPFSPREMVARVNGILRRAAGAASGRQQEAASLSRSLALDPLRRRRVRRARSRSLPSSSPSSRHSWRVAGVVFVRDQLMKAAYGESINVSIPSTAISATSGPSSPRRDAMT